MSAALTSDPLSESALCGSGLSVIETEARALSALAGRVDGRFADACRLMLSCRGRVVFTGMGKSGHVARKIAATLASAGTPAFFVHPWEASHGDLGMLTIENDIDMKQTRIDEVMTRNCVTAAPEMLAAQAVHLMQHRAINALPVVDDTMRLVGALNMHDLLRARVL